jgi:hypothetical protein
MVAEEAVLGLCKYNDAATGSNVRSRFILRAGCTQLIKNTGIAKIQPKV